ncbi:MAG: invasion associated locus B family protein [Alphaproteobacteria bacterium]|jgi:invasion protein IalB|nr:invasion associated locus B family protein [Alphaproteobacteria bacterium]
MKKLLQSISVISMIFLSTGLVAQQPKPTMTDLGKFDNWQAASFEENGKTGCFMVSDAVKSEAVEGSYSSRGRVYMMITHRPANNTLDTVTFFTGYPYKLNSEVTIQVDNGAKHILFTQDDKAWVKDANGDKILVDAMRRGKNLTVLGTSARNTKTRDTFSLTGFSKAYAAINTACNVTR